MRRNGVGIGARMEKGRSEKRVKRGGRKEIGDRIVRSLDVCGSQSVLILLRKPIRAYFLPILQVGWPTGWLVGWPAASNASGTPTCVKHAYP